MRASSPPALSTISPVSSSLRTWATMAACAASTSRIFAGPMHSISPRRPPPRGAGAPRRLAVARLRRAHELHRLAQRADGALRHGAHDLRLELVARRLEGE